MPVEKLSGKFQGTAKHDSPKKCGAWVYGIVRNLWEMKDWPSSLTPDLGRPVPPGGTAPCFILSSQPVGWEVIPEK